MKTVLNCIIPNLVDIALVQHSGSEQNSSCPSHRQWSAQYSPHRTTPTARNTIKVHSKQTK